MQVLSIPETDSSWLHSFGGQGLKTCVEVVKFDFKGRGLASAAVGLWEVRLWIADWQNVETNYKKRFWRRKDFDAEFFPPIRPLTISVPGRARSRSIG